MSAHPSWIPTTVCLLTYPYHKAIAIGGCIFSLGWIQSKECRQPTPQHCLLVIDDEPDLVQSVIDLLRLEYRVLGATRVSEGLQIMARESVHVVMTDQRLPGMTGVEFLKRVKETYPDTVRLLFTAYADIETVTDAINQGNVYGYISKPWDPQELRAMLRQAASITTCKRNANAS